MRPCRTMFTLVLVALAVTLAATPVVGGMKIDKTDPKPAGLRPEVRIALHCHIVADAAADSVRLQQRQANYSGPVAERELPANAV